MPSKASLTRRRSLSDPLAAALLPPPKEMSAERERRLQEELLAKQISDDIALVLSPSVHNRRSHPTQGPSSLPHHFVRWKPQINDERQQHRLAARHHCQTP